MKDMKKLYDRTRTQCGRINNPSKYVKDRNGTVLTDVDDQLKRWREHFQEVLNRPPPETQTYLPEAPPLPIRTGPVTRKEVKNAPKTLKNGKAAGFDNIPAEAWKEGGWTSEEVLFTLLNMIWEAEDIPMDWKLGLLVKLPKKGDLSDCTNSRGIMLLSIASKALSRIILTRMQVSADGKFRDEQAGFRSGRSCCDQITALRIITEQSFEWNTGLYMVFVDFEKAFDSIDREMLWKILKHYGIPVKIVRMIQVLYDGFQARVLHEGRMTEPFDMKTVAQQGCLPNNAILGH